MKFEIEVKGMTASHAPVWKAALEAMLHKQYNDPILPQDREVQSNDPVVVAGDGGPPIAVGLTAITQGTEEAVTMHGLNRPQDGITVLSYVVDPGTRKDPELLKIFADSLGQAGRFFVHALASVLQSREARMSAIGRLN